MKPFLSIKQREGNRWQFFMIQLNKKPGHCYFQTENCFSGSNDYTFWLMLPNNCQESRKKKSLKTTEIRAVREKQLGPKYHERISIQKLTRGQEIKIISQKNSGFDEGLSLCPSDSGLPPLSNALRSYSKTRKLPRSLMYLKLEKFSNWSSPVRITFHHPLSAGQSVISFT